MTAASRNIVLFLILLQSSFLLYGQRPDKIDSLKKLLQTQKDDTNKVRTLYNLSFSYVAGSYADTALTYAQQSLDLAEKLNDGSGIFWSEITLCESLSILGNYPLALEHSFRALDRAQRSGDTIKLCYANGNLAACYYYMDDYRTSIKYARNVIQLIGKGDIYWMWIQMTKAYHAMGQADSALLYAKKAYDMVRDRDALYVKSVISPLLGNAYAGKADYDSALFYYRMGIPLSIKRNTRTHLVDDYYGIAEVYRSKGNLDSALWYGKKIIAEKIIKTYPAGMLKAASLLAGIYELKNTPDSSLEYLKMAGAIKDSLYNRQKTIAVQNLIYKEQERQREIQAVKLAFNRRLKIYALTGSLLVSLIIAGILLRNHRRRQLQHIRNGIADDLHDDIGSTLSSISIMSELAKKTSPEASTLMASIGESTLSIQENMSDIVWAIRSDNDSLENVLQRMQQFASEILDAKDITLDFTRDLSAPAMQLEMRQRKNFYLLFKEVINNAAKHSGANNISVHISQKDHYVEMIIRDNGKGFDPDRPSGGNGMNTLKKRADELNGYLKLRSQPGEGTTAELRFKIT